MDRYQTKWTLLRPVTAVRRRRARRLENINVGIFEANHYRPSFLRFFQAVRADPTILLDANLDGGVILDVGGFEGGWSKRLLRHVGDADVRVLAFEPVPAIAATFQATDPRVTLHMFGLAGRDRTEMMVLGGQGSTIFGEGTVEVELRDVVGVLEGVDWIDLAKVNIEGGEFELIDRMHESGWLARTETLIVQFHEFVPGAHRMRRKARRQLAETHECTWSYPWVYERWDLRPTQPRNGAA